MKISVHDGRNRTELDVAPGVTVLEAFRANGIPFDCACTDEQCSCKCRVLVRDASGVSYRLACSTEVCEGMAVVFDGGYGSMTGVVGMQSKWGSDGEGFGYGVAVDVGATTVVCRLYDMDNGRLMGTCAYTNPQVVFGDDIGSRFDAAAAGKLELMSRLIGDLLIDVASELAGQAGIELSQLTFTILTGNAPMELIADNIDPGFVGQAPFAPHRLFGTDVDYIALEKGSIAAGSTYFVPCVSGHMGGDVVCGLLAIDVLHARGWTLYIDLGTAVEVVVGGPEGVVGCTATALPVFEGGHIAYGMPAYPGAVARLSFSCGEFVPTVVNAVEPVGICGTGLLDAVALMLDHGLLDAQGNILDPAAIDTCMSHGMERHIVDLDGQRAVRITPNVYVTQSDVHVFQEAKSSIAAAVFAVLDRAGVAVADIVDTVVAGGFGQFLDAASFARVGIIPIELLHCTRTVGNATVEGASALLMSDEANDELENIISKSTCMELSDSKPFHNLKQILAPFAVQLCCEHEPAGGASVKAAS